MEELKQECPTYIKQMYKGEETQIQIEELTSDKAMEDALEWMFVRQQLRKASNMRNLLIGMRIMEENYREIIRDAGGK